MLSLKLDVVKQAIERVVRQVGDQVAVTVAFRIGIC